MECDLHLNVWFLVSFFWLFTVSSNGPCVWVLQNIEVLSKSLDNFEGNAFYVFMIHCVEILIMHALETLNMPGICVYLPLTVTTLFETEGNVL